MTRNITFEQWRFYFMQQNNLFAIGMRVGITGGGSLTRPLLISGATSATEPSAVALSGAGSSHMSCTPAGATGAIGAENRKRGRRRETRRHRGRQIDIVRRWLTRHLN